jgi:hypothetical protein
VIYIDASLPSCSTIAGFVSDCLREFRIENSNQPTEPNLSTLETAVRNMRDKNQVPVLCLDQFERFGKLNQHEFNLNFFDGLRAIAGTGAALIAVSKIPLISLVQQISNTSPFFNIFETVRVKPFLIADAQKFITSKAAVVDFDAFERAKMLELAQDPQLPDRYPPLRLQLVGDMLYRYKRLALSDDPDHYRPEDPDYWLEFSENLEEKYRGMVQV